MAKRSGRRPAKSTPARSGPSRAARPARLARPTRVTGTTRPIRETPLVAREIYGIAAFATGLVLLIALLRGAEGLLTGPVAVLLRYAFGIGSYLLPLMLIGWGLTFFVGDAATWREGRIAAGLAVVLVAVIGLAHMGVGPKDRFAAEALRSHGGVIGAALVHGLTLLLGRIPSYVVLLAAVLCGIVATSLLSVRSTVGRAVQCVRRVLQSSGEASAGRGEGTGGAAARVGSGRRRLADTGAGGSPEPTERLAPAKEARPEPRFTTSFEVESAKPTEQLELASATEAAGQGYRLPPLTLLKRTRPRPAGHKRTVEECKRLLVQTLADFDVEATIEDVVVGPTVTLFELAPAPGVKVNRIQALARDIGLALATAEVRIAPIPGKAALGVEVPNEARDLVTVGDVLASEQAQAAPSVLSVAIGKDTAGNAVLADLGDMPHLLIAGATGQGKSVAINAILVSLLVRATPRQVRLILIDPKRIELAAYRDLPHLLVPVTSEAKKAANALMWAVSEMEERYKRLESVGAKKIEHYNAIVAKRTDDELEPLPYIVIVIDELADLMMVSSVEVEGAVQRLSQMARAVGIHLVLATQRPSTDVITGLIKANITTRIAMKVGSSIDSRVILDQPGADKLVGKGDMLLLQPERGKPLRVQGAYVSELEIEQVVAYIKQQAEPDYHEEILAAVEQHVELAYDDPMLARAIELVLSTEMGSTSMLQRRLKLGYTRAARLMDMMEQLGIVGPPDGSKPREVLISEEAWRAMQGDGPEEAS